MDNAMCTLIVCKKILFALLLNPISHSQMFNPVELVGILCKIYLGAIIIILICFDLIKMHIFNCIDHFLQYSGPQWL